jgi:hypothetical protein
MADICRRSVIKESTGTKCAQAVTVNICRFNMHRVTLIAATSMVEPGQMLRQPYIHECDAPTGRRYTRIHDLRLPKSVVWFSTLALM